MKPDWQNKSYAKTSSPSAPSTMNPKLKVGMSTLHSKISQANSNMPQAPKPVVRKFADGGVVRTRSDDEIGDTDPRTGKVDPGSYDRRMKAGEENLNRLKSAVESVRSFFTRDKQAESSPSNITGDSGMGDSDVAKKSAMSGGMGSEKKAEPVAEVKAEEPRRKIEDYMVKKEPESAAVVQSSVNSQAALAPAPAASSNAAVAKKAAAPVVAPVVAPVNKKKPAKVDRSNKAGQSQKDIEALVAKKKQEKVTDTGDETNRLRNRTTKSIPGVVGRFDLQGNPVPSGLGPRSSQVYGGDGSTVMSRAEKRYLQSRIDAGNLTAMERAQAKRAGLL